MPEPFYKMNDVLFGYDEDIHIDGGDLKRTSGVDYIERLIYKRLISVKNDWKLHGEIGSSPNEFIGQPNTRETAEKIKETIISDLRTAISPATINVKVVPVDLDEVVIYIDVIVNNDIVSSRSFKLDFINGFKKVPFDEEVNNKTSNVLFEEQSFKKNKYIDRIKNNKTTL